jgi:serine/threonine protein kinase
MRRSISGFSRDSERAIIMKYMENGSLHDVIERVKERDRPDFWDAEGIAVIICGTVCGMDFIHSPGFVHRDLKPSNLLIDKDG